MKHIFYFIGILFVIYELMWIVSPKEKITSMLKRKKLAKEHKDKKWDEFSKEYKDLIIPKFVVSITFLLWMIAGLLTFNWVAFLIMIIFNITIIKLISKAIKETSFFYIVLHWFNSVLGFAFGIFVIINSYHLKIDLYGLVGQWISLF